MKAGGWRKTVADQGVEFVGRHTSVRILPDRWMYQKPTRQDPFTNLPVIHYRWFALACYSYQVTFVGLPVTQTRGFSVASLLHKPGGFQCPPCYTNQVVFNGLPVTQTRWFPMVSLLHKPGSFQRPPSYTYQVVFNSPPLTHTRWFSSALLLPTPKRKETN